MALSLLVKLSMDDKDIFSLTLSEKFKQNPVILFSFHQPVMFFREVISSACGFYGKEMFLIDPIALL